MIRLAGGTNALTGVQGYKPLTPESAAQVTAQAGLVDPSASDPQATAVLTQIRLPRVLFAMLAGASLSVDGAVQGGTQAHAGGGVIRRCIHVLVLDHAAVRGRVPAPVRVRCSTTDCACRHTPRGWWHRPRDGRRRSRGARHAAMRLQPVR